MKEILTQFIEECTESFYEEITKITNEAGDISNLTMCLKRNFDDLGIKLVKYALEMVDEELSKNKLRKKSWSIERRNQEKSLTTIFGEVKYKRTYFTSKFGKGYAHLADSFFGIEAHERCDITVRSKLLENVVDLSYEKSSEVYSTKLSKQTVLNNVRRLDNEKLVVEDKKDKTKVKTLYVEADEDHVALQSGKSVMPYLVYVHEGYTKEESKRKELKNIRYFAGIYKQSEDLWIEVNDYIERNYDTDYLETVYLAGDGAGWIRQGRHWLPKVKPVLDKYHLNKYVMAATGHVPEMRSEVWSLINQNKLKLLREKIEEVLICVDSPQRAESVKELRSYINSNWIGIKNLQDELAIGCSAEGHVSHILSDRLSTRPLGWSISGVDDMARLRVFRANGGKIFDIIKEQKKEKKRAEISGITKNVMKKIEKGFKGENINTVPAVLESGKRTQLYKALYHFCRAI